MTSRKRNKKKHIEVCPSKQQDKKKRTNKIMGASKGLPYKEIKEKKKFRGTIKTECSCTKENCIY